MNATATRLFYDRIAGIYDLAFNWVLRPGRIEAVLCMNLQPGQRVLEVGVGTGLTLPHYPRGVDVLGIDLSRPMLTEAFRRLGLHPAPASVGLTRMDATDLAFPDDVFDSVFAPYMISVVPNPRRVVSEMARVCMPGGTVVVLNHFLSETRPAQWVETQLTPLTWKAGFRLDLPVETVLGIPGLELEVDSRVNALKKWRLLIFRKTWSEAGSLLSWDAKGQ